MFQSSRLPSGSDICDLDAVTVRDETRVVCVTGDGKAWSWDPSCDHWTSRSLPPAYEDYPDAEADLDCASAGVHQGRVILAGGSENHGFAAWDLDGGAVLRTTSQDEDDCPLWSVTSFEVDGQLWFACGGASNPVVGLWEPSGGELVELDNDHQDGILSLAAGRLGDLPVLAAGGFDRLVTLWDLRSRERIATFSKAGGKVWALALTSLDRHPIVVGGVESGDLYVWDADGSLVKSLNCHDERIMSMDAAVVDGRTIAITAANDGTVRTWDLAEGNQSGDVLDSDNTKVLITRFGVRQVALAGGREGTIRGWYLS
ncbi:WD40 repeat domain-containing protein [Spirillospora sp. NBC_01491]|uniref:WD40 repeat domain-containing protein n=1 Tax=Spirillospora sp. NBC_01491 TaxID=2976007 RepID=UPI002E2F267B|nr:WD40 repeat domain-containing protein [Spirillospora sp. NBC_01491]